MSLTWTYRYYWDLWRYPGLHRSYMESPYQTQIQSLVYEWISNVEYSIKNDSKRTDQYFYHPQPEQIFNLMRRANDPDATTNNPEQLESVAENFDVCRRFHSNQADKEYLILAMTSFSNAPCWWTSWASIPSPFFILSAKILSRRPNCCLNYAFLKAA